MSDLPGLTPAEIERLVMLNEACAQVQHAISKTLRYGYSSSHPSVHDYDRGRVNNRTMLAHEIGSLFYHTSLLISVKDVPGETVSTQAGYRGEQIKPWTQHQEGIEL